MHLGNKNLPEASLVSEEQVELQLLRSSLYSRTGRLDRARRIVDELIALVTRDWPPRLRARIAMEGLAQRGNPRSAFYLESLSEALEDITPRTARAVLLQPLDRCPVLEGVGKEQVERFVATLPDISDARHLGLTVREKGLVARRVAEAYRIVGRQPAAVQTLQGAWDALTVAGESLFPLRDLLQARDRLNDHNPNEPHLDEFLQRFDEEFAEYSLLRASMCLDRGERLIRRESGGGTDQVVESGRVSELERVLDAAETLLDGHSPTYTAFLSARLLELKARLAALRGDNDEANRKREASLGVYEKLGLQDRRIELVFPISVSTNLEMASESLAPAKSTTERIDRSSPASPLFPTPPAFVFGANESSDGRVEIESRFPRDHSANESGLIGKQTVPSGLPDEHPRAGDAKRGRPIRRSEVLG